MATKRIRRAARRHTHREIDKWVEFALEFGEGLLGEFLDEDEARDCWEQCGERLTAEWARDRPGRRPWAFWVCELELDAIPSDEAAYLRKHNLLLPGEAEAIAALVVPELDPQGHLKQYPPGTKFRW